MHSGTAANSPSSLEVRAPSMSRNLSPEAGKASNYPATECCLPSLHPEPWKRARGSRTRIPSEEGLTNHLSQPHLVQAREPRHREGVWAPGLWRGGCLGAALPSRNSKASATAHPHGISVRRTQRQILLGWGGAGGEKCMVFFSFALFLTSRSYLFV